MLVMAILSLHSEADVITLQIRDARARMLAQNLAARRKITMTEAVIRALESELRRDLEAEPLAERIGRIAADPASHAGPTRGRWRRTRSTPCRDCSSTRR